jgi:hypothetical protein
MLASLLLLGGAAAAPAAPVKLAALNIDPASVITTGLGDSADFAHQLHVAFASVVSKIKFTGFTQHLQVSTLAAV